jgi:hypothetical protein
VPQIGLNPGDYEGILAEYAQNADHPLYGRWRAELESGNLTGTPLWFFENYVEVRGAEDVARELDNALLGDPGQSNASVVGGEAYGAAGGASASAPARGGGFALLVLVAVAVFFLMKRGS